MEDIVGNMINAWCARYAGNALVTDPSAYHRVDQTEILEHSVVVVQEILAARSAELAGVVQEKKAH